jgi:hypothetical protein
VGVVPPAASRQQQHAPYATRWCHHSLSIGTLLPLLLWLLLLLLPLLGAPLLLLLLLLSEWLCSPGWS